MTSVIKRQTNIYLVTGTTANGVIHFEHPAIKAGKPFSVLQVYTTGYDTTYQYFYVCQMPGSNGSGYIYVRDINGNRAPNGIPIAFCLVA